MLLSRGYFSRHGLSFSFFKGSHMRQSYLLFMQLHTWATSGLHCSSHWYFLWQWMDVISFRLRDWNFTPNLVKYPHADIWYGCNHKLVLHLFTCKYWLVIDVIDLEYSENWGWGDLCVHRASLMTAAAVTVDTCLSDLHNSRFSDRRWRNTSCEPRSANNTHSVRCYCAIANSGEQTFSVGGSLSAPSHREIASEGSPTSSKDNIALEQSAAGHVIS